MGRYFTWYVALCLVLGGSSCLRAGYGSSSRPEGGDTSVDGPNAERNLIDGTPPDTQTLDAKQGDRGLLSNCRWSGSFSLSAPVNITKLNSDKLEANPFVSADGRTIYFVSRRIGGQGQADVWSAQRPNNGAGWSSPVAYTSLNTSAGESAFTVTADGLTGFLAAGQLDGGDSGDNVDIWRVPRSVKTEKFTLDNAVLVAAVNDVQAQWDPMPAQNGMVLYLSSDKFPANLGGQGGPDIVVSKRSSASASFGPPKPVLGINSASYEANPTLTADRRLMLFNSGRAGGSGKSDIWYATRDSTLDAFATPKPVPVINSAVYDSEAFVTLDGCEVYFVSARVGGVGGWDIYHSSYIESP